ncbi:hypothetical protein [Microbacterium sp. LWO13-1.2]|uniref:hypothetical protein n=1 Tax=Microbacterium sp. LWO13-1.2 TaxID=3135262 RepID=UPI003139F78C
MKGLSRIGFGLALVSLGATIFFGTPRVVAWNEFPWEWPAIACLVVGFALLGFGSHAAFVTYRRTARERLDEREGGIDAANVELAAASAKLNKLRYWHRIATEYKDAARAGQLDADIQATQADQRAAVRRLRSYGVEAEIPDVVDWTPSQG